MLGRVGLLEISERLQDDIPEAMFMGNSVSSMRALLLALLLSHAACSTL